MNQHAHEHENVSNPTPVPYASPIVADALAITVPPKPRIWPALVVPLISIVAGLIAGTIVFVIAIFSLAGHPDTQRMEETLEKIFDHPLGIWIMVLPGQLMFLAAAVVAAMLSPVPFVRRLRLGKGRLPIWTWLLFMAATPCLGLATGAVIESLEIEPSAHLQMLDDIMSAQTEIAPLACAFLVAVMPGLCEEVLFRGYMQSRLLQRWSPVAAVLISSVVFALAHIDPLHVCAVLPTGIWLGVIAYRTESIWPSIFCHFTNNLLALIGSNLGLESVGFGSVELMIGIPCSIAMLASLFILFQDRRSKSPDEAVLL